MEGPESMRGGWNIRDEQIAKIYERYLSALKDANALDFDDLLLKTVELFETSEQTREFYARKFKYVMVDEYQDTNRPQYMLIQRLAEIHRNLARRRRSRPVDLQVARRRPAQHPRLRAGLRRGEDRPPRAELPVDADHPRRRLGRHQPEPQPQGQEALDRSQGRREDRLLPRQRRARGSRLHHPDAQADRSEDVDATMAILYRTNAQSRAIEDALMREGLPTRSSAASASTSARRSRTRSPTSS